MSSIQDNIRRERKKKGFSQEYMAKKLNIAQNNYGKIERGVTQLNLDKINKIAEILDIPQIELLQGAIIPYSPYSMGIDDIITIENDEFKRLKDEIKFNAKIGKGLIFIEYDEIDKRFITSYENLKEPVKQAYLDQIDNTWQIDKIADTMEKDSKILAKGKRSKK